MVLCSLLKNCPAPLPMPSMLEHRPAQSLCLLFFLRILHTAFCRSLHRIPLSHLCLFYHTWLPLHFFLSQLDLTRHYYLTSIPVEMPLSFQSCLAQSHDCNLTNFQSLYLPLYNVRFTTLATTNIPYTNLHLLFAAEIESFPPIWSISRHPFGLSSRFIRPDGSRLPLALSQ